jgi:molybdopterin synthase catalytic subunit
MQIQIELTHSKIIIPPLEIGQPEIGASVEFLGIVREGEGDRKIQSLRYEAYEAMARKQVHKHCEEIHKLHPCDTILFIHRLGMVPVREPSLFIRVLAKHRAQALGMCGLLIDRLKQDVPIWKCDI